MATINGTAGNDFITDPYQGISLEDDDIIDGLEGDDTIDSFTGEDSLIGGSGNDNLNGGSEKDTLDGGDNDDNLNGGSGNDNLNGGSGNDNLNGGSGNDNLNGGSDKDTLKGGKGNDIYIVDRSDDFVSENSNEGMDEVQSSDNFNLGISGAGVEKLTLTGSAIEGVGNELNNKITGNDNNNKLDGGAGNDTLNGGNGDDNYIVDSQTDIVSDIIPSKKNLKEGGEDLVSSSVNYNLGTSGAGVEKLTLTGSAIEGTGNDLVNTITGNNNDNKLDGGTGGDILKGSTGKDTYTVDNVMDQVLENSNEGIDEVLSSVKYTLSDNVETLTLKEGSAATIGIGNKLPNTITGNSNKNNLYGGSGNDRLDGGTNQDNLYGGDGSDTYIVDDSRDFVRLEKNFQNTDDEVQSSVTYDLGASGAGVEKLTLTGSAIINGAGNDLANTITGNDKNNTIIGRGEGDTLDGRAGKDILNGGAGAGNDIFVFRFGESIVSNFDEISDRFVVRTDKIKIDSLTSGGAATSLPTSFTRASNSTKTSLEEVVNDVFKDADGLKSDDQALKANSAAFVVVEKTSSIAGNYLIIDDGNAVFESNKDTVVKFSSISPFPDFGGINPVSDFFV